MKQDGHEAVPIVNGGASTTDGGSPPIDKLMVAQGLQDALFAHPQSGPIPVQVGFVELAIEALRTPDTRDSVNAHEHTFCPHCNPCRRAPEITALEDALRELVACKDLKDRIDRYDEQGNQPAWMDAAVRDYQKRKPLAWKAARVAIRTP